MGGASIVSLAVLGWEENVQQKMRPGEKKSSVAGIPPFGKWVKAKLFGNAKKTGKLVERVLKSAHEKPRGQSEGRLDPQ
jgi:hypothetical protein